MQQTRVSKIKDELLELLDYTQTEEPQLYKRLDEMWRWIKDKKEGLLTSKSHVLNLLAEIIADSIFWLEYKLLSSLEQQLLIENLSSSQRYWSITLFPLWFKEQDPKSNRWKQELLKNNFKQLDQADVLKTCQKINKQGGNTHLCYILDLSMATDLIAASIYSEPLAVQLTTQSREHLSHKKERWKQTLSYWQIRRGLFLSYDPRVEPDPKAQVILKKCATLPSICYDLYIVSITSQS